MEQPVNKIRVLCQGCGGWFNAFESSHAARSEICTACSGIPRYTVQRTDGTPVPEDEPVFVIRASDVMAVAVITTYREMATALAQPTDFLRRIDEHLLRIREWQDNHGRKIPD